MEKPYEQPNLVISLLADNDVITASGDGYVEDPWAEGFGG